MITWENLNLEGTVPTVTSEFSMSFAPLRSTLVSMDHYPLLMCLSPQLATDLTIFVSSR